MKPIIEDGKPSDVWGVGACVALIAVGYWLVYETVADYLSCGEAFVY